VDSLLANLRAWMPILLEGTELTVFLTFAAMAVGLVLAVPIALARLDGRKLRAYVPATMLLEIIRGTPLVLQLYYLFYVLPLVGIRLNPIPTAIIGLGVSYGCFLSEVYRAGIEAIPHTQWEAASALGLPRSVTLWRIILPQALRIVIPPIGNYFIALFKDTALVSVISVQELMFSGRLLASSNFRYFEVFTTIGVIYLVICYPSAIAVRRLERRLRSR
jgi:polar amino acid transport system permease protein